MGLISLISSQNLHLGPGREVTEDEDGSKDRVHAGYPTSHLEESRLPDLAKQTDESVTPLLASRGQQMPGL